MNKNTSSRPTGYWIFWAVWGLTGLGVEIYALSSAIRSSSTFSAFWQTWISGAAHPSPVPPWVSRTGAILTLLFFAWLGPHLAWGVA